MKYLKKFNENLSTEEIENDIQGLLVELKDRGITINTQINTKYISIYIYTKNRFYFNTSDIYEYIMTLIEYMKSKLNISSIKYYYDTLKYLTNLISCKTYDINENPLPNNTIKSNLFFIKFEYF